MFKNLIESIMLVATLNGCAQKIATEGGRDMESKSPFHMDFTKVEDQRLDMLKKIRDDFNLVLEGKEPVHAKIDNKSAKLLDGGTENYLGENYKLTIVKRLGLVGGISGYFYGPMVSFDDGASAMISKIDFYSEQHLKQILKK